MSICFKDEQLNRTYTIKQLEDDDVSVHIHVQDGSGIDEWINVSPYEAIAWLADEYDRYMDPTDPAEKEYMRELREDGIHFIEVNGDRICDQILKSKIADPTPEQCAEYLNANHLDFIHVLPDDITYIRDVSDMTWGDLADQYGMRDFDEWPAIE